MSEHTADVNDTQAPPPPAQDAPQVEHDRYWLDHVYRPNAKQLTVRSIFIGMVLGAVMSVANLYVGLKIGWSVGMAITSVILAFGTFAVLKSIGILKEPLSDLENVSVACAASAAGYFSSAGMVSAIPALYFTQQRELELHEIAIWMCAISFTGLAMAIPMRRQLIDLDRLPFPSGTACAATIKSMHASAGEAAAKARVLFASMGVSVLLTVPASLKAIRSGGTDTEPAFWRNPVTYEEQVPLIGFKGKLLGAMSATVAINTQPLMYAIGALLGPRVGLSLGIGALALYLGIAQVLASRGIVVVADGLTYRSVLQWAVWPGVIGALTASLLRFALSWRSIVAAFAGTKALFAKTGEADDTSKRLAAVDIPGSWFGIGMALCTAFVAVAAKMIFDIPFWMSVIAVMLSFPLTLVAGRACGETDVNPIGPVGKITQLAFAMIHPGNYTTNLMTATVTAGSASHAGDLLTDLKTGKLLGANPRKQFIAQGFGIIAGAMLCAPAYFWIARPEVLGTAELPAPAAQTWAVVADLLARGVSSADRGYSEVAPATLQVVRMRARIAGTAIGDTVHIESGPNAGDYTVTSVLRAGVVLDRDLVDIVNVASPVSIRHGGTVRGATQIATAPIAAPAVRFASPPSGTSPGDYVVIEKGDRELFHRIEGLRSNVASLDHAYLGSGGERAHIEKRALPPYAPTATLIAIILAVLVTLLEVYGPKGVSKYLPSIGALGISWIVPGWDSLALCVGALAGAIFMATKKDTADRFLTAIAAGLVAGGSLLQVLFIILRDVAKVIQ